MRIWDWLICCPAGEENAALIGKWDMAQGGGSVGKDFPHGDLGKCPGGGERLWQLQCFRPFKDMEDPKPTDTGVDLLLLSGNDTLLLTSSGWV